jgi:hypothetical protein
VIKFKVTVMCGTRGVERKLHANGSRDGTQIKLLDPLAGNHKWPPTMAAHGERRNGDLNRYSARNPNGHLCSDEPAALHHEALEEAHANYVQCHHCKKWRQFEGEVPKHRQWTCIEEEGGCEEKEDYLSWYEIKCFSGITELYDEKKACLDGWVTMSQGHMVYKLEKILGKSARALHAEIADCNKLATRLETVPSQMDESVNHDGSEGPLQPLQASKEILMCEKKKVEASRCLSNKSSKAIISRIDEWLEQSVETILSKIDEYTSFLISLRQLYIFQKILAWARKNYPKTVQADWEELFREFHQEHCLLGWGTKNMYILGWRIEDLIINWNTPEKKTKKRKRREGEPSASREHEAVPDLRIEANRAFAEAGPVDAEMIKTEEAIDVGTGLRVKTGQGGQGRGHVGKPRHDPSKMHDTTITSEQQDQEGAARGARATPEDRPKDEDKGGDEKKVLSAPGVGGVAGGAVYPDRVGSTVEMLKRLGLAGLSQGFVSQQVALDDLKMILRQSGQVELMTFLQHEARVDYSGHRLKIFNELTRLLKEDDLVVDLTGDD